MRTLKYITLLHGLPWNLVKKSWKVLFSYWKLWCSCSHGWTNITKISFLSGFSAVSPKILHIPHSGISKYYVDDWKSIFWENNPPTPSTTVPPWKSKSPSSIVICVSWMIDQSFIGCNLINLTKLIKGLSFVHCICLVKKVLTSSHIPK